MSHGYKDGGVYYEWSVAFNTLEPEGHSVWEGCPVQPGNNVFLFVAEPPPFAVLIGANEYWKSPALVPYDFDFRNQPLFISARNIAEAKPSVNSPVLSVGAWPAQQWPLRVGCNLNLIPGYTHRRVRWNDDTEALTPANNTSVGVDVRAISAADPEATVRVWFGTDDIDTAIDNYSIWLRHPSGMWGADFDIMASAGPPGLARISAAVKLKGADRLTLVADSPGSGVGLELIVGMLGAYTERDTEFPLPHYVVRFGAVLCPPHLQPTRQL